VPLSFDKFLERETGVRPFLIVVKKGKRGVKNRLLFEDGAKRNQVSSCLASFFFFCVKQSSQVPEVSGQALIFGSFYQEKEQAKVPTLIQEIRFVFIKAQVK